MKRVLTWTYGAIVVIWGSSIALGCLGDLKTTPGTGGSGGVGGSAGAAGEGGTGGKPMMICAPGSVSDCNTGQSGICAAGKATCSMDGLSMGACNAVNSPSFDNCRTPEDEDCDGNPIASCTGDIQWKYTQAGAAAVPNDEMLMAVAPTPGGKFAVTGTVNGDIAVGPIVNAGQLYLAKLDADGKLAWEKKFGGVNAATGRAIAVDSAGNIVVVGDFSGVFSLAGTTLSSAGNKDVMIAKFTNVGDLVWAKNLGGTALDVGSAVTIDASGNIFASGRFTSPLVDAGGGPVMTNGDDVFVVSYSPAGDYRWSHIFVNPGAQHGRGLATSANGDVIIVGESTGNVQLGGATHPNAGGNDIFIAKFRNSDGTFLWSNASSTGGDQHGRAIAALPSGNFVLTGRFENKISLNGIDLNSISAFDAFVIEVDGATGNAIRMRRAGQAGTTFAQALAVDGAGDIIVHGGFEGITGWGPFGSNAIELEDTFTVKLDGNSWEPIWMKTLSGKGYQFGYGVAVGADGGVVTVGNFDTEMNFGPLLGTVPSTGGDDYFVARFAP